MSNNQIFKYDESDSSAKLHITTQEISRLFCELSKIYKEKVLFEFPMDAFQLSKFFEIAGEIQADIFTHSMKNLKIGEEFLQKGNALYFYCLNRMLGIPTLPAEKFAPPIADNRFNDPTWEDNPYFESIKRSYYFIAKYALKWLNSISTLDRKTRQQVHFYVKNILDFFSPTNYIWTNPEVMRKIVETQGENLIDGFKRCLEDLVHNKGRLSIRTTPFGAFEVGSNLAITPGKIIHQNDLIQLIQYMPTTESVYETPILFIPPWINKYYVLDLSPENSMVRYLVNNGFTVYMISWVNPDKRHANKQFEDYMTEGPLEALDVITKTANVPSVHMVGYCIGGTLLGATSAYMASKKDNRMKTASYFMSLLDFSNAGELGVFIDEAQLNILDKLMKEEGFLNGRILESVFSFLRPNDMVWPNYINSYLLGKEPKAFDLLYWNSDSSNLPYKMYKFYLHNMYIKNRLKKPYRLVFKDIAINLADSKTPAFFIASKTDHITLWQAVYRSAALLGGSKQFLFSDSGHVRGVVNPPGLDHRYNFRTNEKLGVSSPLPKRPSEWFSQSKLHKGSWWPYWVNWLIKQDGTQVPARDPVKMNIPIIEDAPGSYVKRQI